jgi:DNA modification methylase
MAGERAQLVATDPPYLVNYKGGAHPGRADEDKRHADYIEHSKKNKDWSDTHIEGADDFFLAFVSATANAVTERAPWYVWHADRRIVELSSALTRCGLLIHQTIIWVKSRPVLTYSHFMQAHEPCLYGWKTGSAPTKDRRPAVSEQTVWQIPSKIEDGATGVHPTQKPVEIVTRPVLYHTKPGELIYEPFSGSGTAIIGAEKEARRCNAVELSPAFVDVAVKRWQTFTGKVAVLDGDGRSFSDVAEERRPYDESADLAGSYDAVVAELGKRRAAKAAAV